MPEFKWIGQFSLDDITDTIFEKHIAHFKNGVGLWLAMKLDDHGTRSDLVRVAPIMNALAHHFLEADDMCIWKKPEGLAVGVHGTCHKILVTGDMFWIF
jgi:hypothetical protein